MTAQPTTPYHRNEVWLQKQTGMAATTPGEPADDGAPGGGSFDQHAQEEKPEQRAADQPDGLVAGLNQRAQFADPKGQHNHQGAIADGEQPGLPELVRFVASGLRESRWRKSTSVAVVRALMPEEVADMVPE